MLKTSVSLILVIAVALLIFVKTHSAQDIPVEKLKPRWASSASSFVNIAGTHTWWRHKKTTEHL